MNSLNKINIGQYLSIDSFINKLDPRIKIFILIFYTIWIMSVTSLTGYLIPFCFLFITILSSKIPLLYINKNISTLKILFIVTWILHVFFTHGNVLWSWGIINISYDGLLLGSIVTLRLIFLVAGAAVFTLTTSPVQITDAFEKILSPMKFVGFPTHEIAMMLSLSFRFIPILFLEFDKIIKAQICRGVDLSENNLLAKIKQLTPVMIPLFVNTFRRADELALAMEARCYNAGKDRTYFNDLKLTSIDFIAVLFFSFTYFISIVV